MATRRCCQCNGPRATCIRCFCAKNSLPCTSCRPGERGACCNNGTVNPPNSPPGQLSGQSQPTHVSCTPSSIANSPIHLPSSPTSLPDLVLSPSSIHTDSSIAGHLLSKSEVHSMLLSAYGGHLSAPSSTAPDSDWVSRWKLITHLSGSHYFLPRGQCGRRYVSTLTDEINLLTRGTFPSESKCI